MIDDRPGTAIDQAPRRMLGYGSTLAASPVEMGYVEIVVGNAGCRFLPDISHKPHFVGSLT